MASNNVDHFSWTDSEVELLLECVRTFASKCQFEGKDWESVKAKYDQVRALFVERYPSAVHGEKPTEEFPKSECLSTVTRERIAAKVKTIRKNYKKAVDQGRKSGGGRIVMTYYDICCAIWAGAPSTTSMEGGIDTTAQSQDGPLNKEDGPEAQVEPALISNDGTGDDPDNELIPSTGGSSRREKINKYLGENKERRLTKVSKDSQLVHCAREDLALKRKLIEQSDSMDKQYMQHAEKMLKTMESICNSMASCFSVMNRLMEAQMNALKPQQGKSHLDAGCSQEHSEMQDKQKP